ncbi:TetR family transcriptional regulator [Pseudoduganella sp. FT26W]|uniref:TetR family transcriptional regulator n=1 Tax=Duganella aquatilis TaxID=2666082 RepID=A0A844DB55_9BURK|nr:TetR/AcrR family transcriptional regulator [Duganella aquatilis]MRW87525.1 TetR family transcriptional regulator [Duganella aquatilis]
MKKSKIETLDTRRRIVRTATRMFLANGLAETGIASIMSAVGLTQGGFYRHFKSKEHLIAEANIAANDRMFDYFSAAVDGKNPSEALDLVVALYLDQVGSTGAEDMCPLPNLGSELRRSDKLVRDAAMTGYQRLVEFFAALAIELGAAEPSKLAEAIVATMVGAVMLAKLAVTPEAARVILGNARRTVQLMVPTRLKEE